MTKFVPKEVLGDSTFVSVYDPESGDTGYVRMGDLVSKSETTVTATASPGGGIEFTASGVSVGVPAIFYLEDFGDISTPAGAADAIAAACAAVPNACTLSQRAAGEILTNASSPRSVSWIGVTCRLRLRANQTGDTFSIIGAVGCVFDVSVNMDGRAGSGVRLENCALCAVPRSALVRNGTPTADTLAIGVLTKNSRDCTIAPTVEDFAGADGAKAIRGVMVSDTGEIASNTSFISPKCARLIGAGSCESDAIFLEGPHEGGATVQGSDIADVSRRFIKCQMKNVVVRSNRGKNTGAVGQDIFAFVGAQASGMRIVDNEFSTEGAYGATRAVDLIATSVSSRGNKYYSAVSASGSSAIARSGRIDGAEFIDDEFSNFERLVNQSSATAETGQSIKVVGKYVRAGGAQNAVTLSGGYDVGVFDVNAPDSITTNYFISAADVTSKAIRLVGSFNYSQPTLNVSRFLWEYSNRRQMFYASERLRYSVSAGRARIISSAAPTGGVWEAGDEVQKPTLSAGQSPGWICVAGGTPGTWSALPALA